MQVQAVQDKVQRFLDKKYRVSRSFSTRRTYYSAVNKFLEFVRKQYNLDTDQLLREIKETKHLDPIEVLDDYYTFLSNLKRPYTDKIGLDSQSIRTYVTIAKEFLNSEGCKIYLEDMKQRFRLPRKTPVYEKGLTKAIINRVLRLSNPKLAASILIACSSGMRIAEIVQLRLSDIDFTAPTAVTLRKETTKTRQTRVTCISSEATKCLKDFLAKSKEKQAEGYIFLRTNEDRIRDIKRKLENGYKNTNDKRRAVTRLKRLEQELLTLSKEDLHTKYVIRTRHSLEVQLTEVIRNIPELNEKNENGRNSIHFHAFRSFFKTQVTDAHQSDFAEALMGHTSLKLVYYRQNEKARAKTYLGVEHALTIADTEKIDRNYAELQQDNQDLRLLVDGLSKKLRNLENKIKIKS